MANHSSAPGFIAGHSRPGFCNEHARALRPGGVSAESRISLLRSEVCFLSIERDGASPIDGFHPVSAADIHFDSSVGGQLKMYLAIITSFSHSRRRARVL